MCALKSATLPFSALGITPSEVYDAMGYRGSTPDEQTVALVARELATLDELIHPAYTYRILEGEFAYRGEKRVAELLRFAEATLAIKGCVAGALE